MLIGLHGKKQAGKDTVFERIRAIYGPAYEGTGRAVKRVSFADLLYKSAAAALGIDVDLLREFKAHPGAAVQFRTPGPYGPVLCKSVTVRQYLQRYGTEAHRELFGDDFWVDNIDLEHARKLVVVTDVRFRNEAQAVVHAGGTVVHVIGPEEVENTGDGHASEERLPAYLIDHELPNTVRTDDFRTLDHNVRRLVTRLLAEERPL